MASQRLLPVNAGPKSRLTVNSPPVTTTSSRLSTGVPGTCAPPLAASNTVNCRSYAPVAGTPPSLSRPWYEKAVPSGVCASDGAARTVMSSRHTAPVTSFMDTLSLVLVRAGEGRFVSWGNADPRSAGDPLARRIAVRYAAPRRTDGRPGGDRHGGSEGDRAGDRTGPGVGRVVDRVLLPHERGRGAADRGRAPRDGRPGHRGPVRRVRPEGLRSVR